MTTMLASSTSIQPWVWVLIALAVGVVVFAIGADLKERNSDPDDETWGG